MIFFFRKSFSIIVHVIFRVPFNKIQDKMTRIKRYGSELGGYSIHRIPCPSNSANSPADRDVYLNNCMIADVSCLEREMTMPKRTIQIQSASSLGTLDNSLVIKSGERVLKIPYEDVWVLIVERHETSLSGRVLSDLADAGIGVLVCGRNHMPNGLLLPLGAHSRHAAIVEDQLAISKPLKKQLWKRIVVRKILNQARVAEMLDLGCFSKLREDAKGVTSGDATGREAVAASRYFRELIVDGSRRSSDIGACLDYGYAVLRAGIARSCVAGGWLVSRGIHHQNDLNAFNLVDDLIEPFRPLVDLLVMQGLEKWEWQLIPESKASLARLYEYQVEVSGRAYGLQAAIQLVVDSLRNAILEQDSSLLQLPEIMGLELVKGEE